MLLFTNCSWHTEAINKESDKTIYTYCDYNTKTKLHFVQLIRCLTTLSYLAKSNRICCGRNYDDLIKTIYTLWKLRFLGLPRVAGIGIPILEKPITGIPIIVGGV